ncbi:MAG: PAS domain S-box protein [Sporomusaceae bacterium]|nr:PAS domain S-box protein [Sporomusaceae bacterium]
METNKIWKDGKIIGFGIFPLLLIAVLVVVFHYYQEHYLFHIAVEVLTTGVSFGMFIIALNTYRISRNHFFVFLGLAFGSVGLLNLLHALAGYGFVEHKLWLESLSQQPLWLAARLIESISLLASFYFLRRNIKSTAILLAYTLILAVLAIFIRNADQRMILEVAGLNVVLLGGAFYLLNKNRERIAGVVYRFMFLALLTAIGCELIQVNTTVESNAFMVAHVLNYLSFYFMYKALIEATLQAPYQTMFHDLCAANSNLKNELSGREKAETALKTSERKYRAVVNSLPDFLFRMLADGTIVEIMPTKQFAAQIFPGDESKNIYDILPDDIADSYVAKAREALTDDSVKMLEYRINADGVRCDREARLFSSGEQEVLVLVRDVTEQNKNLSESRMLYHAIKQSASMVVITDIQGDIVFVNPKFSETTGYTAEEAIGRNVRVLNSGYHTQEHYKRLWDTILAGKAWYGEFKNKKKNGELYWESASISAFRNREGVITRFVAVKEDITERRLAEQRLRQSENRYRSLLEQSSDGIFTFDPNTGKVEEANSRFMAMLGYSSAEIVELTLGDISVSKEADALAECRQKLDENQTVTGLRQFRTKDNRLLFVEISASMVLVDARHVVMINVRDVTENRRRQEALHNDFRLAAAVQHSFLPPPVTMDRVCIETIFEPVHLVSGDLYGYKWLSNGKKLSGFLFDIMGHGLATTLKTSALMILFSQAFESDISLKEKMGWVNAEAMRYFNDDSFAAAFCFEIDLDNGTLTYVAGGITHFLASINSVSGQIVCEGSLVGIENDAVYEENTIHISSGDNFFFITDGFQKLLPQDELNLTDFDASVAWLRRLTQSEGRRDDCSALCISIK